MFKHILLFTRACYGNTLFAKFIPLLTEDYEDKVLKVLKHGKPQALTAREEYHLFSTFHLVSMAEVDTVVWKTLGNSWQQLAKPMKS